MHVSGGFAYLGDWANYKIIQASANVGMRLDNLLVEGREHTNPDALKAIINIQKGDPLFALNPQEAKDMIERLSWVREAQVQRRLPDTIYIHLTERTPMALWQHDKELKLIDVDGHVITESNLKPFKNLIVLTGAQAPQHAFGLLNTLRAEPLVMERVESAMLVSSRRWDLRMDDGKIVKLPEDDLGYALRRLADMQEKEHILDRNVLAFDLRESDRIIVQSHPDADTDAAHEASYNSSRKQGGI